MQALKAPLFCMAILCILCRPALTRRKWVLFGGSGEHECSGSQLGSGRKSLSWSRCHSRPLSAVGFDFFWLQRVLRLHCLLHESRNKSTSISWEPSALGLFGCCWLLKAVVGCSPPPQFAGSPSSHKPTLPTRLTPHRTSWEYSYIGLLSTTLCPLCYRQRKIVFASLPAANQTSFLLCTYLVNLTTNA
jgi:hypothetical protein